MGLIGSSTPFVTGRPVTLLQNSSVLSEGAVGFAVRVPFSIPREIFQGLEPISDVLVVTEFSLYSPVPFDVTDHSPRV
jgi:hypothetical protein